MDVNTAIRLAAFAKLNVKFDVTEQHCRDKIVTDHNVKEVKLYNSSTCKDIDIDCWISISQNW